MKENGSLRKFLSRKKRIPTCSAVIVAAGASSRMGKDKICMEIGGVPVIIRAIRAFEESELIDEIVVVTREDRLSEISELISNYGFDKVTSVISGGATRFESSLAGVLSVRKEAKLVAIHDCARPLVSQRIISDTVYAASEFGAACPVVECTDTMKLKSGDYLGENVDRASLCAVQTPQIFSIDIIKGALTYVVKNNLPVTDDTSAVAYLGFKTRIVQGERDNIKLTTVEDIPYAEAILKKRGEL